MGLATDDIGGLVYGDLEDDDDLEAELRALQDDDDEGGGRRGGGGGGRAQPPAKGFVLLTLFMTCRVFNPCCMCVCRNLHMHTHVCIYKRNITI